MIRQGISLETEVQELKKENNNYEFNEDIKDKVTEILK